MPLTSSRSELRPSAPPRTTAPPLSVSVRNVPSCVLSLRRIPWSVFAMTSPAVSPAHATSQPDPLRLLLLLLPHPPRHQPENSHRPRGRRVSWCARRDCVTLCTRRRKWCRLTCRRCFPRWSGPGFRDPHSSQLQGPACIQLHSVLKGRQGATAPFCLIWCGTDGVNLHCTLLEMADVAAYVGNISAGCDTMNLIFRNVPCGEPLRTPLVVNPKNRSLTAVKLVAVAAICIRSKRATVSCVVSYVRDFMLCKEVRSIML